MPAASQAHDIPTTPTTARWPESGLQHSTDIFTFESGPAAFIVVITLMRGLSEPSGFSDSITWVVVPVFHWRLAAILPVHHASALERVGCRLTRRCQMPDPVAGRGWNKATTSQVIECRTQRGVMRCAWRAPSLTGDVVGVPFAGGTAARQEALALGCRFPGYRGRVLPAHTHLSPHAAWTRGSERFQSRARYVLECSCSASCSCWWVRPWPRERTGSSSP
jgi:hypothetical protein